MTNSPMLVVTRTCVVAGSSARAARGTSSTPRRRAARVAIPIRAWLGIEAPLYLARRSPGARFYSPARNSATTNARSRGLSLGPGPFVGVHRSRNMAAMDGGANSVTGEVAPRVTRFAPSPTGELHLGNARTALFNLLLARHAGGRFLLRIEDTDAERSREAHSSALLEDLRWLGIEWDAGPEREDDRGPYRQSQRGELYRGYLEALEQRQAVYPCYCTPLELELSRRAQLAAGKPPRYAGTCRELNAAERASRADRGSATLRFRVPHGAHIDFVDFVRGPQSFLSDDIGDFVVRRAEGSGRS